MILNHHPHPHVVTHDRRRSCSCRTHNNQPSQTTSITVAPPASQLLAYKTKGPDGVDRFKKAFKDDYVFSFGMTGPHSESPPPPLIRPLRPRWRRGLSPRLLS